MDIYNKKASLVVDIFSPGISMLAYVEEGVLRNIHFDFSDHQDRVGNIYLGKVINIVHSLSAYFVDYGTGKNGFLSFVSCSRNLNKEELIIVQVVKNEKDNKGAKLTSLLRVGNFSIDSLNHNRVNKTNQLWQTIYDQVKLSPIPRILYKAESMIHKVVNKINRELDIYIDGQSEFPEKDLSWKHRLHRYNKILPLFYDFGIGDEIKNLATRSVSLQSGGVIVIDIGEAMTSIDVNSSSCLHGNLEETALRVNLEAAAEIAKQIKLRDLSGIIAIDFIDMHNLKYLHRVEEEFARHIKNDPSSVRISHINEFGVLMLSRQRSGFNVYEMLYKRCNKCVGYGFTKTVQSMAFEIISEIRLSIYSNPAAEMITVECPLELAEFILNDLRAILYNFPIYVKVVANPNLQNTFNLNPKGEFKYKPIKLETNVQQIGSKKLLYPQFYVPFRQDYFVTDGGMTIIY